jgi:hypothetical protein
MKTKIPVMIGILIIIALCIPGVSAVPDPFKVNGAHYNLNIIGVKTADQIKTVGDSMGHTMFVKLNGKTKIIMTQDPAGVFDVVDRNGLDGQAEFNIAPGYYNVYATALGKPNNAVDINAWGLFDDALSTDQLIWLGYVKISRNTGKPVSTNINELFYVDVTLCTAVDAEGACTQEITYTNTWVFDIDELVEYYWDYDNAGVKLLKVQFYQCTLATDPNVLADDYCRWQNGDPIIASSQTHVPW